jgi:hypothetical protein
MKAVIEFLYLLDICAECRASHSTEMVHEGRQQEAEIARATGKCEDKGSMRREQRERKRE